MNIKAVAAIGLLAIGVAAVGISIVGIGSPTATSTTYRTSAATTTTVEQTAAASGNLVAAKVATLAFGEDAVISSGTSATTASGGATTGSTTATTGASTGSSTSTSASGASGASVTVTWPVTAVNVGVGDLVAEGDILATADTATAELAVREAEANLAAARKQRRIDLAGSTSDARAQARDQVNSAQRQLSQARSSYSNTVAEGNLKLAQARRALADARDQLAADKKAGAPAQTLKQDRAAISQAEQSLASTRLQVASSNSQASGSIANAKASLKSANRSYDSATTAADNAVLVADDIAIANAEAALADAQGALEAATLVAPMDGRVTVVNAVVGEESTGTAIEMQSTQMALSVSVTEDDILSLQLGQQATVDISATGTTATGTVTAIDPVASSSGTSSVVSYAVVVTLDETGGTGAATAAATSPAPSATAATAPLAGMSAEITIVIASAENVTAVPAIALSGTSGSYTVRVLGTDGSVESRAVEVGLIADDYAQITSGIAAGETVVTGSSADRTTTTTTSSGRDQFGPGMGGISGAGGMPQPPAGGFPGGN